MSSTLNDLLTRRAVCAEKRCTLIAQLENIELDLQSLDRVIEQFRTDHSDGLNGYNLSFTIVRKALIDSVAIPNPNWNQVLWCIASRLTSREDFSRLVTPSWRSGLKAQQRYIADLDISYHGVSAPDAWKALIRIAAHLRLTVELEIQWQGKVGAQYPGRMVMLRVPHFNEA